MSLLVGPSAQLILRTWEGFRPESRAIMSVIPSAPSTLRGRRVVSPIRSEDSRPVSESAAPASDRKTPETVNERGVSECSVLPRPDEAPARQPAPEVKGDEPGGQGHQEVTARQLDPGEIGEQGEAPELSGRGLEDPVVLVGAVSEKMLPVRLQGR